MVEIENNPIVDFIFDLNIENSTINIHPFSPQIIAFIQSHI